MDTQNTDIELSTEEKIKAAARKVFTQKGYDATRTRDIAAEAGINLALLNYYFRSKERLFEIIMTEQFQQFFGAISPALHDEATSLEDKMQIISSRYIDLLLANPDLPLFIVTEVRRRPQHYLPAIGDVRSVFESAFVRQLRERKPQANPLHFLMNLMGMCVFPFVMRPVLQTMQVVESHVFENLMQERKQLIPVWIKTLLETS
ncbi:DNA-binding transcriptional regulator, AcrR family [Flexibacter flexilis DSM 6793]|uniref:DNA-binding transcriptional regulator, AcrR family n=1 Tax=Flexibacter flexilis DSM 6793 TaxID=927664 RepID=A0A1I1INQ8_9BACT|nr:TetR family transcriptional regulator [Flexibacter flexilis]SFC37907.1 DNA-binding transcriptional regulator, AcrR family [Flexibacter flexilis DSM 6793]